MLYRLSSITPARYCSLDSTEDCCLSAGQRAQQGRLAGSLLAYVVGLLSVVGLSSLGDACTMPLPDETKAKSAKDLIARFQSNINTNSEAPLKPRHSFGSNERFEGDNSNTDISEAKRVPSSRISNARASLEAGLSALSLSRSASHASSSSLSSSSGTHDAAPRVRPANDGETRQAKPVKSLTEEGKSEDNAHTSSASESATSQAGTPSKQALDATEVHAPESNNGGIESEQVKTTTTASRSSRTRSAQPDDKPEETVEDDSAGETPSNNGGITSSEDLTSTAVATPSKPLVKAATPVKGSSAPLSQPRKPATSSPALLKARPIPKAASSPLPSPAKATSTQEEPSALPSSSEQSSKATLSSSLSSTTRNTPAKTPSKSQGNTAKTPKAGLTPSPAVATRRSVISPSPRASSTPSSASRLTRPTEASAKKVLPPAIEHASDHIKSGTSARTAGNATPARTAATFSNTTSSASRSASVLSSSSTAKARRTPLSSSASRRSANASEDAPSATRAESIASPSTNRKKALSPAEIGRAQAAASTSPSSSSLARTRTGLHVPPSSASTPAKSPVKSSSSLRSGSPATTPTSTSHDTLSRLMRPTIASQAHARSPARSPVASASAGNPARSRMEMQEGNPASVKPTQGKGNAPTALKKTRSYAGTASVGSRARVPRESLATRNEGMSSENVQSVEQTQVATAEQNKEDETLAEKEQEGDSEVMPEDENIPDIPTDDEGQLGVNAEEERGAIDSRKTSEETQPEHTDIVAPPSAAGSSSEAATSVQTEQALPSDTNDDKTGGKEAKVFTGFGPNRPYGKIGLPTEEATPEEIAAKPADEEHKILPPNLRIKQPRDLEEKLEEKDKVDVEEVKREQGSNEDFKDKWGTREGGLPMRSPGLASTNLIDGSTGTPTNESEVKTETEVKKVPIWMRKGGEP